MMRLAVVIPAKNEAKYLPVLLTALLRQTRVPDEIIVADAGSTDGTREVARSFVGVTVVHGGIAAVGRNAGVKASTAEIVLFLDADAIIEGNDWLAKAVAEFEERKFDLVTCDVAVKGGTRLDRLSFKFYNRYVRLWGSRHPHPIGTMMMVWRKVHNAIGGFDPAVTFAEDHDYGLLVRDAGYKFGVLNSVKVGITMRRQEKIGRLRFLLVNGLAEPYIMLFGSIKRPSYGNAYDKVKK
jgi:glycosyltransferase involved in cell wall biosynthesis